MALKNIGAEKLRRGARGAWRLAALGAALARGGAAYAFQSRHRRDTASKALWLQGTCRALLRALHVEIVERGDTPEPAKQGGAMIAGNHLSYLDIVVIGARTPVVFVAKKEVRGWPVFGWFAAKAGTRFIDRTQRADVKRVSDELGAVLAAGVSVVVFLEGTSSDGSDVLPFRSSLLEPAVANAWPVVPAGLRYEVPAGRSAGREVCYWGDMTLAPHLLNLATLPWVRARLGWGARVDAGAGVDRKALAVRLREDVVALRH